MKRKDYFKKCLFCEKEFITKNNNQKFCCFICSTKHIIKINQNKIKTIVQIDEYNNAFFIIYYKNIKYKILIDIRDKNKIEKYKWHIHKYFNYLYIQGNTSQGKYNQKMQQLHRFLLDVEDINILVDHRNGDTFDNRRDNLRQVNKSQNAINSKLRSDNKSGYKGISWDNTRNKWVVRLRLKDKYLFLGQFDCIEDAFRVRQEAENKYYGEYNRENLYENKIN
jgi:hypothetical protein